MANFTIKNEGFNRLQLRAKGRNGFMKCRGLEVNTLALGLGDGILILTPITSKGASSDAARLELPVSAIPEMIAVLEQAQAEYLALEGGNS